MCREYTSTPCSDTLAPLSFPTPLGQWSKSERHTDTLLDFFKFLNWICQSAAYIQMYAKLNRVDAFFEVCQPGDFLLKIFPNSL